MQEMQETWVQSLGWIDPLEKEMATHSSILAWEIPWTEEPGKLTSTRSQSLGHNWGHMQHGRLPQTSLSFLHQSWRPPHASILIHAMPALLPHHLSSAWTWAAHPWNLVQSYFERFGGQVSPDCLPRLIKSFFFLWICSTHQNWHTTRFVQEKLLCKVACLFCHFVWFPESLLLTASSSALSPSPSPFLPLLAWY